MVRIRSSLQHASHACWSCRIGLGDATDKVIRGPSELANSSGSGGDEVRRRYKVGSQRAHCLLQADAHSALLPLQVFGLNPGMSMLA